MTLRPRSVTLARLAALSALAWIAGCSPSEGQSHPGAGVDGESGGTSGSTGGASDTGGAASDTGGASASGGSNPGSGGTGPGSGGSNPGSGGSNPGSGGSLPGSGGVPGSGGAGPGSGGTPSSGGTPGSGGGGPLPAYDAGPDALNNVVAGSVCQRLAEIQCAAQEHCCTQQHSAREACITTQKTGCVDGGLDYVTLQSRSAFDGAGAPAILKAFSDRAAVCDPSIAKWATQTDALRGIVKGTLASEDLCTPPGTTDAKIIASYLAACADGDHTACLPHQVTFNNLNPDWVCTALAGINGNCFTDVNCDQTADAHGLYCNNDISAPVVSDNWKCVARKTLGQSCDSSNQCESLYCTKGATKQSPGVCLDANADNAFCIN